MRFVATLQPQRAALDGLLHARGGRVGAGAWWTIIECHDDVGANIILRLNAALWSDADARAINKGFKCDAVVVNVANGGHGKSLKAAGVRQDGTVPTHEVVRAAKLRHALVARTQHEMKRVVENALATRGAHLRGRQAFHCGRGGNGHERGRLHVAVRSFDNA